MNNDDLTAKIGQLLNSIARSTRRGACKRARDLSDLAKTIMAREAPNRLRYLHDMVNREARRVSSECGRRKSRR
jgi:hypothetical protein